MIGPQALPCRAELQDKSYQLADAVAQKMRMEAVALVAERREQDLRAELQAREVEVMETQVRAGVLSKTTFGGWESPLSGHSPCIRMGCPLPVTRKRCTGQCMPPLQSRLAESQARLTEAERSLGASSHRKDSMVKEIGELSHQLEEAQRALETQRTKAEVTDKAP